MLELLRATQLSAAEPRMAAELQLKQLHENESFSVAMVTIGAHTDIPTADRLAALVTLKNFVNTAWSPALEDFAGKVLVNDQAKSGIRRTLLSIIYGVQSVQETKVVSSTAAVVAAIASSDFPEEWPDLLDSLLNQLPQSNDDQTQSILVVLGELVEGGLDEDAFYRYAERLFGCLHEVAVNSSKRLMVRAHAVNIFRTGLDFLENLKDKEESGIRSFADSICHAWSHFFIEVVREALPAFPSQSQEEDSSNPDIAVTWRGIVALKIQVILVSRTTRFDQAHKLIATGARSDPGHLLGSHACGRFLHRLLGFDPGAWRPLLCLICRRRATRRPYKPVPAFVHVGLSRH